MGFIVNYNDIVGHPTKIFSPDPESMAQSVENRTEIELIYHIQIELFNTGFSNLSDEETKEKFEYLKRNQKSVASFSIKINRKNLLNELLENEEREVIAEKILAYVLKGKLDAQKKGDQGVPQSYTNVPCFDINFSNLILVEKAAEEGRLFEEENLDGGEGGDSTEKPAGDDKVETGVEGVEAGDGAQNEQKQGENETEAAQETAEEGENQNEAQDGAETENTGQNTEDALNNNKEDTGPQSTENSLTNNKKPKQPSPTKRNKEERLLITTQLITKHFSKLKKYFGISDDIQKLGQLTNQSMQPLDYLFPEIQKADEDILNPDRTVLDKSTKISKQHNVKFISVDKNNPKFSEFVPKSELLSVWMKEQLEKYIPIYMTSNGWSMLYKRKIDGRSYQT